MTKIKFYGIMKKYMPEVAEDGFWHCDGEGKTIGDLLTESGATTEKVGMTILVNRVRKDQEYVLSDGDTVTVMPLVAGG